MTGGVLLVATVVAWYEVVMQAMAMPGASAGNGMSASPLADAGAFLVAWGVMMAAMMLPSAAPMIALYATVHRNLARTGQRGAATALFAATYLLVWLAFGVPVYLVTLLIQSAAETFPAIGPLLPYGVGATLVIAGLYQFSPWKRACLAHCRTPLGFLMGHWRPGYLGTLRVGLAHAAYCVGCCAALMAILVVAGAMGLQWVLLIAAVVFAEKVLPAGNWIARLSGVGFVALGLLVILQPGLAAMLRGASM